MIYLCEQLGIDTSVKIDNLPLSTNITMLVSGVSTFLFCLLGGNLISYTIIARILKIPRHDLEQTIEEQALHDSKENFTLVQKFYKWCLDVAYN
jgi:hypothetical protein